MRKKSKSVASQITGADALLMMSQALRDSGTPEAGLSYVCSEFLEDYIGATVKDRERPEMKVATKERNPVEISVSKIVGGAAQFALSHTSDSMERRSSPAAAVRGESYGRFRWWYLFGYHTEVDAGATVSTARQRAHLSLRRFARAAGTSHSTLSAYESGAKVPTVATLARIVRSAGFALVLELSPIAGGPDPAARGRELVDVLELAALFPARHDPFLTSPRFGSTA